MKIFIPVLFLVVCAVPAFGQGGLATITGTIVDPSGAVVANAPIQVRNIANGQVFTAASTDTGNYTVLQLPIGDYDMAIAVPGFKTYNHNAFHLAAQQTMREDVRLEVGTATEAVTVTAEASLLKTESSELVHNVTISQMNNLPIMAVGAGAGFRDPFALTRMIPGITYVASSTMVVNGNPDDTVQIRQDGMTTSITGFLRQYTSMAQASTEAIEEVAVQTSNYAAEFGTAGGAVLNMSMKSGTNRYSGTAYDYAVNEILNSAAPYTGLKGKVRRHNVGFTFGGPVRIPKVYDGNNRTFFFFNYEAFKANTLETSATPTVPIQAYRDGNFFPLLAAAGNQALRTGSGAGATNYTDPTGLAVRSGMIFDPATTTPNANGSGTYRLQFPGNLIPAGRFDPISMKILAMVPLPKGINHLKGQFGGNYQEPFITDRDSKIPSIKIDQTIGSKGRLSGYWQSTSTASQYAVGPNASEGFPLPISASRGTFISAKVIRVNYDHTLTPTMLLHLGAGWNSLNFDDHAPVLDYNAFTSLGLRGSILNRTFPVINIPGTGAGGAQAAATGGLSQLGPGIQGPQLERRPMGNVTLNWVKGNHTYKMGAEYRLEKYPNYSVSDTAGRYTFGNSTQQTSLQGLNVSQGFHGFNFASFMMGDLSAVSLNQPLASNTVKSQWALYAQDTWKLTRKLTVDYGLRWDLGTYGKEMYGRNGNLGFNVLNPSAGGHPGGQIYEATCGCTFASNYPYAVGPRVGAAYQINTKTVLRGGFGIVYSTAGNTTGASVNSANAGTPGFGLTVGKFQDGIPSNVKPIWPNFNINAGHAEGTVTGAPTFLDPNAGRPARQYQWSLGLQREITKDTIVEASYVANRGVWWPAGGLASINVLKQSDLTSRNFNDFTSSAESALLTTPIANLSALQRSTLAGRGIVLPYSNFPAAQNARQSILPFPQYTGAVSPSQAPLGKTWYDSLQVNVTQRFSHGLSANANYTWSKNLDLMSSTDIFNRQLGKNISGNDVPQQFRVSAEYQVPSFANSGIRFLSTKTVSYILGNWGIGWYMQYQSAGILNRPSNQGTIPLSNFLGRGPGAAQLRTGPDGKPMNPWSVNWVDYDGVRHTDPIDINCHCFDPTKTIVFNRDAWESIPNGQWANSFSDLRYYRGIRQPQENLNVSRNFRFGERVLLHVRVEFQNILNRTRLPQPSNGTGGNFSANPTVFGATNSDGTPNPTAGLYNGGFGTITPYNQAVTGMRSGIFVGRISF